MNIIKSFFNDIEINVNRRRIFHYNNNIYLIYENKVNIGKLNEALLFIPQYIIVYDSKEILESERNNLLNNTIEKYLNNLNCDLNNPNLQILNFNNQNIGKLIVLNVIKSKDKIDNQKKDNKITKVIAELNNFSKNKFDNLKFRTEYKKLNKKKYNCFFRNIDDNQNETKKYNYNTFVGVNKNKIENSKIEESNKKKEKQIAKSVPKINQEKIKNDIKDNINNSKIINKLLNNNIKEKFSEINEENTQFKNINEKNKKLIENNILKKGPKEQKIYNEDNLNKNELIDFKNKIPKPSIDLGKSINIYEGKNNKLRGEKNIIIENDNKNKNLKIKMN